MLEPQDGKVEEEADKRPDSTIVDGTASRADEAKLL